MINGMPTQAFIIDFERDCVPIQDKTRDDI